MKKGYRELLDEANAEIEVVSPEEAAGLLDDEDTIFVDLRDPREVERDGKIPGAKHEHFAPHREIIPVRCRGADLPTRCSGLASART